MKLKKSIFILTSLFAISIFAEEYRAPAYEMKMSVPVDHSKATVFDDKFKVESGVDEGRKLASEEEEKALQKNPEEFSPSKDSGPKPWYIKPDTKN